MGSHKQKITQNSKLTRGLRGHSGAPHLQSIHSKIVIKLCVLETGSACMELEER